MNEEDIDGPIEDRNPTEPGIDGFLCTGLEYVTDWSYTEQWFKYFKDINGDDSWGNLNLINFFILCFIVLIIFTPVLLGFISMAWITGCFLILASTCISEAFDFADMPTIISENEKYKI